jgi:hypothetical protein
MSRFGGGGGTEMSHLRIQNMKCDKNSLHLPLDYYIVYSILLGKRIIF